MYPLQGQAGIPMRGDLWVCPLCFSSSGAEDPVDAVVQRKKDDNLVAQAFSAASMCFATKAAVAEHVKRIHGIADCKSKKYVDLFHRFRFRGADGIVQRHVYAQGQRHILAINAYWARSQDKNHNKRDYYNVIRAIVLSGCVSDPLFTCERDGTQTHGTDWSNTISKKTTTTRNSSTMNSSRNPCFMSKI